MVRKKGSELTRDAIRGFLSAKIEKWMLPDDYVFIDEVPRISTGKFNKLGLRQQLLEDQENAA